MMFSMKIYYFIIKLGKIHIIPLRTLISYFISCKIWAGPEKTRIISYCSNRINKYWQNLYHSTCQKMTIENSYISHVSGWDDCYTAGCVVFMEITFRRYPYRWYLWWWLDVFGGGVLDYLKDNLVNYCP
jgi:hypothetical protein